MYYGNITEECRHVLPECPMIIEVARN